MYSPISILYSCVVSSGGYTFCQQNLQMKVVLFHLVLLAHAFLCQPYVTVLNIHCLLHISPQKAAETLHRDHVVNCIVMRPSHWQNVEIQDGSALHCVALFIGLC
jgi:hypothetical protein